MKIVISTCDEYGWLVPVFLHFLRRMWPDNPYEIEIITEKERIAGEVFYTKGVSWSSGLIAYLEQCEDDKILLILEDYFLQKIVDTKKVKEAEELCEGDVGCVMLKSPARYYDDHSIECSVDGFREYPLGDKYSLSLQPAIWQKEYLLKALKKDETAWATEINGSRRLGKLKGDWRMLWSDPPILTVCRESLMHRGNFVLNSMKWAMQELLNLNNLVFLDVGELGWSLYLSAHLRWLKERGDFKIAVIALPDRRCLYEGIADEIIDVPELFYEKYDITMQDSFKIRHIKWRNFVTFFLPCVPVGYRLAEHHEYPTQIYGKNRIFKPYPSTKKARERNEILIFPRCRSGIWEKRNLPLQFYASLIRKLCITFPALTIRTIGTEGGAYNLKIRKPNYINWVGKDRTIQDLIDRCQFALAAVGAQSAPPKISLLQGVPTFMIGHQEDRHVDTENWMDNDVKFYKVGKREYAEFDGRTCQEQIIKFVREVQFNRSWGGNG